MNIKEDQDRSERNCNSKAKFLFIVEAFSSKNNFTPKKNKTPIGEINQISIAKRTYKMFVINALSAKPAEEVVGQQARKDNTKNINSIRDKNNINLKLFFVSIFIFLLAYLFLF